MLNNDGFKQQWVNRYVDLINSTFNCQYMLFVLDSLINIISPEMPGQIQRWGGTMAQAKVHQEIELEIHHADKLFVKKVLNEKLIPLMQLHGFKVANRTFNFKEQEHIDLPTRLEMDLKLAEKIKIDESYFYETYNVPAAMTRPNLPEGEG